MGEDMYTSKSITTKIMATSRMSIRVKDNYFTIEYTEERSIPDKKGVDLEKEREALWDTVNTEVDNQAQSIWETFNN